MKVASTSELEISTWHLRISQRTSTLCYPFLLCQSTYNELHTAPALHPTQKPCGNNRSHNFPFLLDMSLAMVKTGVEISSNDEKITGPILLQALLTLWTHITWCYHQVYGTLIRLIPLESWRERLSSTKQDVKGKRTRSGSNAGKAGTGTTTPLRRSRRLKEKQAGNSPTASSSSSSDDQITDSDSNASDVQHPRQLGRLRSSTRPTKSLTRKNHPTSIRKPIPTHQVKKTLVLDLDETLIHSTSRGSRNHDHMVEVLVDRHVCLYYVYKRPYCDLFLKKVRTIWKIGCDLDALIWFWFAF